MNPTILIFLYFLLFFPNSAFAALDDETYCGMATIQEKQALDSLFKAYEAKRDYEVLLTLNVDSYVLNNTKAAFKSHLDEMEKSLKNYASIMKTMPQNISSKCPSFYDSMQN